MYGTCIAMNFVPIGTVNSPRAMHLKEEIEILEQHSRTAQLVVANLVASGERLTALPADPKREQLLGLQQHAIEITQQSLEFSESTLVHLRSLAGFYARVTAGE
jgi:hypothetical protein